MLYTQMQNIFENNFKLLLTDNVSTSGVILGPVNAQANPSHPCPLPLLHTYPDLGTHPLRVHASSRGGGGGSSLSQEPPPLVSSTNWDRIM